MVGAARWGLKAWRCPLRSQRREAASCGCESVTGNLLNRIASLRLVLKEEDEIADGSWLGKQEVHPHDQ